MATLLKSPFIYLAYVLCCFHFSVQDVNAQPGVTVDEVDIPGHLQPIGSHRPKQGDIDVIDHWPDPSKFYNEYVKSGKPLLFKGLGKNIPAYKLWTDDYLSTKYGNLMIEAEKGKKENRSHGVNEMKLKNFIKVYKNSNVYMVQNMLQEMMDEYTIPKPILCGGYTNFLQEAVIWFSSGGTKSVLHHDGIDNINCLMDGEKRMVFIDKKYVDSLETKDGWVLDGSYHRMDVEKVDLVKYPELRKVEWWEGKMEKGDCLFIPFRWYHHVQSSGPRNLAINIWFIHLPRFNYTDCEVHSKDLPEAEPLSNFKTHSLFGNQQLHSSFLESLQDLNEKEEITPEDFMRVFRDNFEIPEGQEGDTEVMEIFSWLDSNHDLLLDWHELYGLNIDEFVKEFPYLFDDEIREHENEQEAGKIKDEL